MTIRLVLLLSIFTVFTMLAVAIIAIQRQEILQLRNERLHSTISEHINEKRRMTIHYYHLENMFSHLINSGTTPSEQNLFFFRQELSLAHQRLAVFIPRTTRFVTFHTDYIDPYVVQMLLLFNMDTLHFGYLTTMSDERIVTEISNIHYLLTELIAIHEQYMFEIITTEQFTFSPTNDELMALIRELGTFLEHFISDVQRLNDIIADIR